MAEQAYGFKEWQLVLQQLQAGAQSLILRKGGIHEGKNGFHFDHTQFYLIPSYYHEQANQLQLEHKPELEQAPEGTHRVRLFAHCEHSAEIHDRAQIDALRPHHCWSDELLEQRWQWQGKNIDQGSLTVAIVRIYQLAENWDIADGPRFGGCRSWFKLPEPPAHALSPHKAVLSDQDHQQRVAELQQLAPSLKPQQS